MLAFLFSLGVLVQTAASAPPDTAVPRVGTRLVLVFRGALGATSAAERVTAAARRIETAIESGADSVSPARP